MSLPHVADLNAGEWQEHSRFPGIYMKGMLTTMDNPLSNANVVQVPSGRVIGRHRHMQQFETIWIIQGNPTVTVENADITMKNGQMIAIPMGVEHALRNDGEVTVELLTFFTPPLE